MDKKRTSVLSRLQPADLNKPPHVLSQLVDMMIGEWQSTHTEDEQQLIEHLSGCIHCQLGLSILIEIKLNADRSEGHSETSETKIQKTLARLEEIIHQTLRQDGETY